MFTSNPAPTANPARTEVVDVLAETLLAMLIARHAPVPTPAPAPPPHFRPVVARPAQPLDSEAV